MDEEDLKTLGPLKNLVGTWESATGNDVAPADDRGTEENKYRERIVMEPTGLVQNHEQSLYGLRYHMQAWRIGENDPFHDEVGYWLWDAKSKQVMKCVTIPRGLSMLAGGNADANARKFKLTATRGSTTFGISSGPFLEDEFQTVKFELDVVFHDDGAFSYEQTTSVKIKSKQTVFEHTDRNTLKRVGS